MAEAKKTNKKSDASKTKKINDVSKESKATPASRAIIVNNRPILKDPMMADTEETTDPTIPKADVDEEEGTKVEVKRLGKKITPEPTESEISEAQDVSETDDKPKGKTKPEQKPKNEPANSTADELSEALRNLTQYQDEEKTEEKADAENAEDDSRPETTEEVESDTPEDKSAEPKTDNSVEKKSTKPRNAKENAPEPTKQNEDEGQDEPAESVNASSAKADVEQVEADDEAKDSKSDDGEAVVSPNETDSTSTKEDTVKSDDKPKQRQLTDEQVAAIESGKYFLPIQTASNKRLKRDLIIFAVLSLFLVVVWLDVLLDADLIELGGIKALTDFL